MGHPFKHFRTITRHRHKVIRLCFQAGIGWQGLRHDLSKYAWSEFAAGSKYYVGTGSPISAERKIKGYSEAWLHHKGRNRHHFEYWMYYNSVEQCYQPIKMPLRFVKEMLCDRIAATMVYNGKNYNDGLPLEYFERKGDGAGMHPQTAALLHDWLRRVAATGYRQTLKEVRKIKEY